MFKKGDLSINIIIVAAIGMLVLLVLILIFTGRINIFNQGVNAKCEDAGGTPAKIADGGCTQDQEIVPGSFKFTNGNDICCKAKQ